MVGSIVAASDPRERGGARAGLRRRWSFLRGQDRRDARLLGHRTCNGQATPPPGSVQRRSTRAGSTPARCGPTAPSPAGARTTTASRPRRPERSSPSAPAGITAAGSGPTGRSRAGGAPRNRARSPHIRGPDRDLPLGQRRQHRRRHLELRGEDRRRDRLLGLQRLRPRRSAGRDLQRRRRGGTHGCGLATDASVVCWGGFIANGAPFPTPPAGIFTAVSSGYDHSCAIRDDGTLTCMGDDAGRAGDAPGRDLRRRQRRVHPLVRSPHQRRGPLLGRQRLRRR